MSLLHTRILRSASVQMGRQRHFNAEKSSHVTGSFFIDQSRSSILPHTGRAAPLFYALFSPRRLPFHWSDVWGDSHFVED